MAIKRSTLRCRGTYSLPLQGPGAALKRHRGIIFPFTPTINTQTQVEYGQYELTHTNYQQHSYIKTRQPNIQLAANFVNQTREEALYTAGVIHFLKVVTKMHFGENDPYAGTPPPTLLFSSYGSTNFHNVPVLVAGFSLNYPDDIDFVELEYNNQDLVSTSSGDQSSNLSLSGESIALPIQMVIAVDLVINHSHQSVEQNFNLQDFANGSLYKQGFI